MTAVIAGARCLKRCRLVVASFNLKLLHIDLFISVYVRTLYYEPHL